MKINRLIGLSGIAAGLLSAAANVHAQSSVTLMGVLDTGFAYLSNTGGHGKPALYSGQHEPSWWGFRGTEDLGDGNAAFFNYTQGLSVINGTSSAKEAYVGLSSPIFGRLAMGRQYDLILPFVGLNSLRGNSVSASHPGDYDRAAGIYLNNAIKYSTPVYGGLQLNAMYSFGDSSSGSTNTGNSQGASVTWDAKNLRLGAFYLNVRGVAATPYNDLGVSRLYGQTLTSSTPSMLQNETVRAVGGYYDLAGWRLFSSYTNTRLTSGMTGASTNLWTTDMGAWDDVSPFLRVGGGYSYSKLDSSHWNIYQLFVDYFLSKRTDIYFRAILETVGSGNRAVLFSQTPSSTNKQWLVGPGIETKF